MRSVAEVAIVISSTELRRHGDAGDRFPQHLARTAGQPGRAVHVVTLLNISRE